ncbi:MAG: hypothetical protein L3J47_11235 [Sulfurovum sp.]|nr:hypothetical protein [Sulfurovum sp.]
MAISNQEIFESFYAYCKEHTIEEVVREFGGSNLYVPSFKTMFRDRELVADHLAGMSMRDMQRKYYLSDTQIRRIIAANKPQPSLFTDEKTHQE